MSSEPREGTASAETDEEVLRELLEEVADSLGLDAEISVSDEAGLLTGTLRGGDLGLFIGRHGQTIDAVQHLAQRIVFRGGSADRRVVIDADGYRERRQASLQEQADLAADEALSEGRAVALEAMPAAERRLVHEYLRDRGDVETYSEGEEPDRHLVIAPFHVFHDGETMFGWPS
jgi:spoIIIJ-associated protein